MKVTFTVKEETKTTGYITVALDAVCDTPGVTLSMSSDGLLFITTPLELAPLALDNTRELVLAEEEPAPEGVE